MALWLTGGVREMRSGMSIISRMGNVFGPVFKSGWVAWSDWAQVPQPAMDRFDVVCNAWGAKFSPPPRRHALYDVWADFR